MNPKQPRIERINDFEAWQKILEEWKEVSRMKKLNQELYDLLGGSLMYVLEYSERNSIRLPNREALYRMADRIHLLIGEINAPTENQQRKATPDDSTEDKVIFCLF